MLCITVCSHFDSPYLLRSCARAKSDYFKVLQPAAKCRGDSPALFFAFIVALCFFAVAVLNLILDFFFVCLATLRRGLVVVCVLPLEVSFVNLRDPCFVPESFWDLCCFFLIASSITSMSCLLLSLEVFSVGLWVLEFTVWLIRTFF